VRGGIESVIVVGISLFLLLRKKKKERKIVKILQNNSKGIIKN